MEMYSIRTQVKNLLRHDAHLEDRQHLEIMVASIHISKEHSVVAIGLREGHCIDNNHPALDKCGYLGLCK